MTVSKRYDTEIEKIVGGVLLGFVIYEAIFGETYKNSLFFSVMSSVGSASLLSPYTWTFILGVLTLVLVLIVLKVLESKTFFNISLYDLFVYGGMMVCLPGLVWMFLGLQIAMCMAMSLLCFLAGWMSDHTEEDETDCG